MECKELTFIPLTVFLRLLFNGCDDFLYFLKTAWSFKSSRPTVSNQFWSSIPHFLPCLCSCPWFQFQCLTFLFFLNWLKSSLKFMQFNSLDLGTSPQKFTQQSIACINCQEIATVYCELHLNAICGSHAKSHHTHINCSFIPIK